MLNAGRAQIAKDLGHVFVRQGLGSLELDDEAVLHEQVGIVIPNQRPILVINFERMLLLDVQTQLPEAVSQRVFIYLFQVAVLVIAVNREPRLSDHITQLHNVFHS